MQDNLAFHRLYRSRENRRLAGVAGGLGQYLAVDPTLVRLAFVFLTVASGLGLLVYLILWLIMPTRPLGEAEPLTPALAWSGSETIGYLLLGLGALFLAANLGLFRLMHWAPAWPLVLIGVGVLLLLNRRSVAS